MGLLTTKKTILMTPTTTILIAVLSVIGVTILAAIAGACIDANQKDETPLFDEDDAMFI